MTIRSMTVKHISCILCVLLACLGLFSAECSAAELKPEQPCSLTIDYTQGGIPFPDQKIEIYRVAEVSSGGRYSLIPPFDSYPVNIHGIASQQEWRDVASTLTNYIAAERVPASYSQTTDASGAAIFTGIKTGLYLVKGIVTNSGVTSFSFESFMIYLPSPENGGYNYDLKAKPKCTYYTPTDEYTVVKLWNDSGNSERRSASVTVDILKDGSIRKSVTLDRSNNWTYSWKVLDGNGVWSVVERNVPKEYKVSVTNNRGSFVVTNTRIPDDPDSPDEPDLPVEPDEKDDPDLPEEPDVLVDPDLPESSFSPDDPDDPDDPGQPDSPEQPGAEVPKTGDTSPILLYIMILCISGFGLMILGFFGMRGRNNAKK